MNKKLLPAILLLLCYCTVNAQNSPSKTLSFPEIGWSIQLPGKYELLDENAIQALEGNQHSSGQSYKKLFALKNGQLNYMDATLTPFNPKTDGTWNNFNKDVKNMVVESLKAQIKGVKIDTLTSYETVDQLRFEKFHSTVTLPDKRIYQLYFFSRLIDKQAFACSIAYTDEQTGKELMDAWRKSKFKK